MVLTRSGLRNLPTPPIYTSIYQSSWNVPEMMGIKWSQMSYHNREQEVLTSPEENVEPPCGTENIPQEYQPECSADMEFSPSSPVYSPCSTYWNAEDFFISPIPVIDSADFKYSPTLEELDQIDIERNLDSPSYQATCSPVSPALSLDSFVQPTFDAEVPIDPRIRYGTLNPNTEVTTVDEKHMHAYQNLKMLVQCNLNEENQKKLGQMFMNTLYSLDQPDVVVAMFQFK